MQVHGIMREIAAPRDLPSFPSVLRQLSFEADDAFPYMAKVISKKENIRFGKHLIANNNIEVGDCIIAAPPFANIEYLVCTGLGCFQCGKITKRKIQCPNCIDVWFCSNRCKKCIIHQQKCDPMFKSSDCRIVRLATQMIITACNGVGDTTSLLDFCRGLIFLNKKSNKCHPPYSQYAEILSLKGRPNDVNSTIARRVVKYVMQHPQFESVSLNSEEQKRILFSLAYRHANSIPVNSFDEEVKCSKGGACVGVSMFDMLSRFNHSCKANLDHYIDDDNITYCVAARPIKAGEQLFINYLGDIEFASAEERKKYLREMWGFECTCEICYLRSC